MKIVLLSGGSGKRLWPLSNDSRSKQFLKILSDEDGEKQSMAERVWSQLERAKLSSSTTIATSHLQVEMIQKQLGKDIPLVIEPERRDTFPAIALTATYLYSVEEVGLEEVVTVLPVDPYVEDDFFETIKQMESVIKSSQAELALIGAIPTHPSEKYGYIIPCNDSKTFYSNVEQFVEKPLEPIAEKIIDRKGLWNCGVFSFKLGFLISYLQKSGFPIQYEELLAQYHTLPKTSFDYEVVEKTKDIVALRYSGFWKDLGTWNTLTEEMLTNQIGVGRGCNRSENTHIINELDIPVAVLGISNAVIAASPDGILVTDKKSSPRIKTLLEDLMDSPRFEEHLWGWWKELDRSYTEHDEEVFTRKVFLKAGKHLSYHIHPSRSDVWTIIKGEGCLVINGMIQIVRPGDVVQIKPEMPHALKAYSDLEMIEVQKGINLSENQSTCILEEWDDIKALDESLNQV